MNCVFHSFKALAASPDSAAASLPDCTVVWVALMGTAILGLVSSWFFRRRYVHATRMLQEQEDEVRLAKQRLELALEGANLGLWDWDTITNDLYIDERWAAILGYTRDEIPPHVSSWTKLLHPDDIARVERKLNDHLKHPEKSYFTEQRLRKKNGEWKWILDTGRVVGVDDEGNSVRVTGVIMDIDRIKKTQFHLEKLASSDPLTGVYNRRYFFSRLNEHFALLKRNNRSPLAVQCSVAILDIDFFKKINDTMGHIAGDYVLKNFAKTLHESMRLYDVLARYGGEEFVILFLDCDKATALSILERIRDKNIATKYSFSDSSIEVRFSAGLSAFSDFEVFPDSVDELIALADDRLYLAKEGGRDRIMYESPVKEKTTTLSADERPQILSYPCLLDRLETHLDMIRRRESAVETNCGSLGMIGFWVESDSPTDVRRKMRETIQQILRESALAALQPFEIAGEDENGNLVCIFPLSDASTAQAELGRIISLSRPIASAACGDNADIEFSRTSIGLDCGDVLSLNAHAILLQAEQTLAGVPEDEDVAS